MATPQWTIDYGLSTGLVSSSCMQSTSHILLIRPVSSAYNPETAASNAFQRLPGESAEATLKKVQGEFDSFVDKLRSYGVAVHVVHDTPDPPKPDAVFPNNWISLHEDGRVILYPMMAASRRNERRREVVEELRKTFVVKDVIDLSCYEKEGRYLEGTGSIVFDHVNRIAYACLSPRTDKDLFLRVCGLLNYQPVFFTAVDAGKLPFYHTNVMMCMGEGFCLICLNSITNKSERNDVEASLRKSNLEIIPITVEQVEHFAGNMLAVKNQKGESLLVCSQQAADSLTVKQRRTLEKYARLLALSIPTIETIGGGSVRCMMAEIFLEPGTSVGPERASNS